MRHVLKLVCMICLVFGTIVNVHGQKKEIAVVVDERVELITTTQLLFGYPLVGRTDIQYKHDVEQYFAAYENDADVAVMLKITQNGFSFVKPFNYVYHFTFPEFKKQADFSSYENDVLEFGKIHDTLLRFNAALQRFYEKTSFHNFYLSHQSFYDSITAPIKKLVDRYNLVQTLEAHYGTKQNNYTLVLSPLFIEAGMSTWIEHKNGNNLYSIVGPNLDSKATPNFDTNQIVQYLLIHEFSHPFCNPYIDENYPQLEKDSTLFGPISKALDEQGCGDWKSALCEMLTRANEIVLVRKVFGRAEADKVYDQYMKQQWIYIEGLVPLVDKFQADRKKYPTLKHLMPEVIRYFDTETAKQNQ